jgi:hypothetical protein
MFGEDSRVTIAENHISDYQEQLAQSIFWWVHDSKMPMQAVEIDKWCVLQFGSCWVGMGREDEILSHSWLHPSDHTGTAFLHFACIPVITCTSQSLLYLMVASHWGMWCISWSHLSFEYTSYKLFSPCLVVC